MLPHPTLDKLQTLRLTGMLKALSEQLKSKCSMNPIFPALI